MMGCMSDLIDHFGVNSIEQATKEGFSGIPNYFANHDTGTFPNRPVPMVESLARLPPSHQKGDPQRERSSRVAKVMNRVGQKGDTGCKSDDGGLKNCREQKSEQ